MRTRIRWRVVAVLLVLGGSTALVLTRPARLGLDLRGGTQIVLEAKDTDQVTVERETVERTVEVLRRRVDALGVAEPTLQASGDRRIIVELPGVSDPDEALEVLGRTAQLTFHGVLGSADADPERDAADQELVVRDEAGTEIRVAPATLTGDAVQNARAALDQDFRLEWTVQISFRQGDEWARITGEAACQPAGDPGRRVAIVLDDEVISSPEVDPAVACGTGITGGETVITGDFTEAEAKDLALLIRAGALPVPVEVIEQRTVGATLGEGAIRASSEAVVIGAALTVLYMLLYYRLLGGLAAVALLAYAVISFGALLAIGATLTLPGIAGFVLAVGMAVDANVLVFERLKEEHAGGRGIRPAVPAGFERAWSAIADSNATTVLAAVLLFLFASGAVKGFAVTVTIGVLASMFTALVLTRVLVELAVRVPAIRSRPRLLGLHVGARFRTWLGDRRPDLIGRSRRWFAISAIALVLAVGGVALRGLHLGLEFRGGRLAEYAVSTPVDLDALRTEMARAGLSRAVVQESGRGNVTIRTGRLSPAEERRVEESVAGLGGDVRVVREEFVGPTFSSELLRNAVIALVVALAVQLAYLALRFRWTFATSAVTAMFHDVAILLGVFAWLGKELDGVFLAALLTVIGYSINDSVVVFDRIREQMSLRSREPIATVANDAVLQTVPRTINTGLGAVFILLALYLLGGETLTDFALALLIGISVGTYSSILTATPIAVALEGVASRKGAPVPVRHPRARASTRAGSRPARGRAVATGRGRRRR